MPTQRDVAKQANVSISTVWRVLNEPNSVRQSIRHKVEAAVDELGYLRKRSQGERQPAKQPLELIVPDLGNPFFAMVIKGCESVARTHGHKLMIADSENDPELEAEHLELALSEDTAGVVIIPADGVTPMMRDAVEQDLPMVFLDRTIEDLPVSSVTSDNHQGAYQATKYLVRLGHHRILFLAGGTGKSSAQQRLAGFRDALQESGNGFSERHVIDGQYDFEASVDAVTQVLTHEIDFSAIFASADVMAFGAKRALEARGLTIPGDVSLVGYDDIHLASSIGLTTVAQPALEMGRNAIMALIDRIEGRLTRRVELLLQPRLIIRDTCRRA